MLQATDKEGGIGIFESMDCGKLFAGGIVLELKPAYSLRVVVRDKEGSALENAEVSLLTWHASHGLSRPIGRTDVDGEMMIEGLYAGGRYRVAPRLGGYYHESIGAGPEEMMSPGTPKWRDTLELVMDAATRAQKGKVVDEGGNPVGGVLVETNFGPEARTDSDGEFTIKNLPDSRVSLMVRRGDFYGSARASKDTPEVLIKAKKVTTRVAL